MLTANEVQNKLSAIGPMKQFKVVFRKVNGEERTMICMMDEPSGPPKNPAVVPVMDTEKSAWRSFKIDSVVSLEEL